jgi:hypothetical protein
MFSAFMNIVAIACPSGDMSMNHTGCAARSSRRMVRPFVIDEREDLVSAAGDDRRAVGRESHREGRHQQVAIFSNELTRARVMDAHGGIAVAGGDAGAVARERDRPGAANSCPERGDRAGN